MYKSNRKGFTLIELLVVIAIIAVLSVVVILTLNPAELLRQARDSNRISDVNTVKSAISLYLADAASPAISSTCMISVASGSNSVTCNGRFNGIVASIATSNNGVFTVAGAGWVPVDFTAISSGAPIGNLPKDPTNSVGGNASSGLWYAYIGSSTPLTFELNAALESAKYGSGGSSDAENTDGGNYNGAYETGTALTL
ncbi:MAG: hypothetical protein A2945_00040 [Candidatus Liptonbacteria bacterium RIFCSPLOWO2_01_FULL_52_25]|uniref:Type II secretion system protein GspG C-terminal domain-containing protein n=1 Tax=Candidatus Liptonbacteria bacterium RIFCSPLOWO2_01_FULL_52_25 TaxID=1798650 RepID=A0A1G2CF97_9BACT|nr:MAG: hypothetical protein A2945_00040 [Candidatus Liptonbacteria bacterium RIFCSPLOWO2_01_FULL_52_25]